MAPSESNTWLIPTEGVGTLSHFGLLVSESAALQQSAVLFLQAELHPYCQLFLGGWGISHVGLQDLQVLRGSHLRPTALWALLRPGDESESALHPGDVAHKSAGSVRHSQPGVLCVGHPGGHGESLFAKYSSPNETAVVAYPPCLLRRWPVWRRLWERSTTGP